MTKRDLIALIRSGDYTTAASALLQACEPGEAITSPWAAHRHFLPWALKRQEHFVVATLDAANQVIAVHEITKGLANRTLAHPREVFRPAILDGACAVILCQNHPSGKLEPSEDDFSLTQRLKDAGEILGIPVLDHIIISKKGFFAMSETSAF